MPSTTIKAADTLLNTVPDVRHRAIKSFGARTVHQLGVGHQRVAPLTVGHIIVQPHGVTGVRTIIGTITTDATTAVGFTTAAKIKRDRAFTIPFCFAPHPLQRESRLPTIQETVRNLPL
jgi:hypothetical protein